MNERLEKEIDDYINSHFSEADDGVLLSDASGVELAITDIAPMVRRFYNLALEDVRKEVGSMVEGVKALKIESSFNEGKLVMAHDTLFFIDELKK